MIRSVVLTLIGVVIASQSSAAATKEPVVLSHSAIALVSQIHDAGASRMAIVRFAGTSVSLPIPNGQCVIPRDTEAGRPFYALQEEGQKGTNKVAILFADCLEWGKRVADHSYRIHSFGSYLFPLTDGLEKPAPSDYNRPHFIHDLSAANIDAHLIEVTVKRKLEEISSSHSSLDGMQSLGYIATDDNAAYMGQIAIEKYPTGKINVACVVAMTLVRHVPVFLNLYADIRNSNTIQSLLDLQKKNMTDLVGSNSR
jgi:hypothetical protein